VLQGLLSVRLINSGGSKNMWYGISPMSKDTGGAILYLSANSDRGVTLDVARGGGTPISVPDDSQLWALAVQEVTIVGSTFGGQSQYTPVAVAINKKYGELLTYVGGSYAATLTADTASQVNTCTDGQPPNGNCPQLQVVYNSSTDSLVASYNIIRSNADIGQNLNAFGNGPYRNATVGFYPWGGGQPNEIWIICWWE
jgi:hypothetical protein